MNKVVSILKGVVICIIFVGGMFLLSYEQTHYTRVGVAKQVAQHGVVYEYEFSDATGNSWNFFATDIINTDDVVKIKMYNNNTDSNIYDDMVVDFEIIN